MNNLTYSDKFLDDLANKKRIRVSIRSLCFFENKILVEQASDDPDGFVAFPGGGLEFGESFHECIRREYREEMNVELKKIDYLFVLENLIDFNGKLIHSIEHYVLVELEDYSFQSQENEIIQKWISINELQNVDLRPLIIRDAIINNTWKHFKHNYYKQ